MTDFTLKYDGTGNELIGEDPNGNKIAIPLNDVDVSGAVNTDEINDNGSGEVSIASPLTVQGRQTTGSLPMGVAQNYQSGPAHGEGGDAFQGAAVAPSGQVILAPRDSSNVGVVDVSGGSVTYSSGPAHGEGGGAFVGATVAPSGQVILAPGGSSNVGVSSAPPGIALAKGLSF